jgi:uncharacterized membrane protein YdjX (TVP38/TMEM64 family)
MNFSILLRGLLVIAAFIVAGHLVGGMLDTSLIDSYIRGKGPSAGLLFVAAGGLLASIGMSRQIIAFFAGYAFGFMSGALLGLLATVAGCITTFYISRRCGCSLVEGFCSRRFRKVSEYIHDNTFSMSLLIRLLPAGSNFLVNLAAGASGVRSLPFFFGSALGYIPQMLVFSLIGSGTSVDQSWQIAVAIVLFGVSAMLGVSLYRKYRRRKSLDESLEYAPAGLESD